MTGKPKDTKIPSVIEIMTSISRASGISLGIPDGITDYCCGMAFSSKGYMEAFKDMSSRTLDFLFMASGRGRLPVVLDSSSCALTVKSWRETLSPENREKWDKMTFLDSNEFIHDQILPNAKLVRLSERVVLHPNCSVQKMGLAGKMKSIAEACSGDVIVPESLGCCGYAGDRGLLFPELNRSASLEESREVRELTLESNPGGTEYYSSNTTCETGMSIGVGQQYQPVAYLVYKSIFGLDGKR